MQESSTFYVVSGERLCMSGRAYNVCSLLTLEFAYQRDSSTRQRQFRFYIYKMATSSSSRPLPNRFKWDRTSTCKHRLRARRRRRLSISIIVSPPVPKKKLQRQNQISTIVLINSVLSDSQPESDLNTTSHSSHEHECLTSTSRLFRSRRR